MKKHLNKLKTLITDKQFWYSNLKTLSLFLIIAVVITGYQQRNMISGMAPKEDWLATGQPTLVYFWATWCGICTLTSPAVNNIAEDSSDLGYQIKTVALSSGSDQALQQHMSEKAYSFPLVNDDSADISARWGVQVTPSLFFINEQGDLVWHSTGLSSEWGIRMRLWLISWW